MKTAAPAATPPADLCAALGAVQAGHLSATALLDAAMAAADSPACAHVYLRRFDRAAQAAAAATDMARAAGAPLPPLAGLAVSVKDLFDVAGWPTTAGSRAMADAPPAAADCPATRLHHGTDMAFQQRAVPLVVVLALVAALDEDHIAGRHRSDLAAVVGVA